MDKAQKELVSRLAEAREEATQDAAGEVLRRNQILEQDLQEQAAQVISQNQVY